MSESSQEAGMHAVSRLNRQQSTAMNQDTSREPTRKRLSRQLATLLLLPSVVLLGFVTYCYFTRLDFCAAITVFPPWCWVLAGLVLTVPSVFRNRRRLGGCILLLWLVFLLLFADTPMSMIRLLSRPRQSEQRIRVVTLNCAANGATAGEIAAYDPDIVLFQESPGEAALEALAQELYGSGSHGLRSPDTSIICRGELTAQDAPGLSRRSFVHARIRLDSQREVDVICLRLMPSPVRIDLWSYECWREYRRNREKRREELQPIVDRIASLSDRRAIICGGDFNAPPGDAVFNKLTPRLSDSFHAAGRGWGRTILNETPLLRIDQIWLSQNLRPLNVEAHRTEYSDHRMVICDFVIKSRSETHHRVDGK